MTTPSPVSATPVPEPPAGPARRRTKILAIVVAVVVSGVSIWISPLLFGRRPPPSPAAAPGVTINKDNSISLAQDALQWSVLKLEAATTARASWTDALSARVRIDEARASKVGAPLGGRITRVFVELGQRVKVGMPLFAVASPDLATIRAERSKAEVDVAASRATLDRTKAMVAARAVPGKEELVAQQQYQQALVALRLAQSKLGALRVGSRAEGEFLVSARRDGVVVEKNAIAGQEVAPDASKPVIMIADLSVVWVLVDLSEADAPQVHEGASALITSPSAPGLSRRGTVAMVSAVVDPDRHTIPIRVQVDNADGALRPNMFAQVKFALQPHAGVVEVAASAIVSDGAKQYVYVQSAKGRFTRRDVVAGSMRDGKVPVLSGLRAGEAVVREGAILLDNQINLAR
jgi:membrane fusion protein, heavy metal efflux system